MNQQRTLDLRYNPGSTKLFRHQAGGNTSWKYTDEVCAQYHSLDRLAPFVLLAKLKSKHSFIMQKEQTVT